MRLLADLRRALETFRPDDAEELLREVELRMGSGEKSRAPGLARGRLLEEIAPPLREAFPQHADDLLTSVAASFWPLGVAGPVTAAPTRALDPHEVVDLERDSYPSFVVVSDRMRGMRLLLHHDLMSLGRGADADLRIVDDTLSRIHLRITLDARAQVYVEDSGSTSGTFVNQKHVHETWLANGDEVRCGQILLRFLSACE